MDDALLRSAISTFTSLLRSSWLQIHNLGLAVPGRDASEYVADWAQASWEMVVEAAVSSPDQIVYLEPYGAGADCNDIGSRVWQPGVSSTHVVHAVPLNGEELCDRLTGDAFVVPTDGVAMDQFVTLSENGWYQDVPPFDHVLIHHQGREKVVALDEVDFILVEI